jgi:LysR family transcriptional regulator for metE and metH
MPNLSQQLDMKHLRLVDTLYKEGNLSQAAKCLNLTQPALSHQLKNLESYCDQPLFHRQGKRMVPTQAGKRLLSSSQSILDELNILADDMKGLARGIEGSITLSSECYTCFQWLPRVIPQFASQYPNVPVNVNPNVSPNLLKDLEAGALDMAISMSFVPQKFHRIPLFKDELVVLVHPQNPLAKQARIDPHQLLDQTLIVYPNSKDTLLNLLFHKTHERPRRIVEMPLTEGILEWCAAGLGITVMARWAAQRHIKSGDLLPVSIDLSWTHRTWHAVTLTKELPDYMRCFIELVISHPPVNG